MATKEAPTQPVSVSRVVVTPQDPKGLTTALKRELARSIGRMGGKKENLDVVLGTIDAFAKHAKVKVKEQQAAHRKALADAKTKADHELELARKRAELRIKAKEAQVELLQSEIAAIAGKAPVEEASK